MKNRTKQTVQLLLIALSLLLIGAGTVRGEAQLVLTKAINICMECIGIG